MHGYNWLLYKQKNHLQPMAGYRQTRNSLLGISQSRKEKTTINGRYSRQFKYVSAILIVLCISNGWICAYITGIHDKRIVKSCTMWCLPQTIRVFRLLSSILSTDNFCNNICHRQFITYASLYRTRMNGLTLCMESHIWYMWQSGCKRQTLTL